MLTYFLVIMSLYFLYKFFCSLIRKHGEMSGKLIVSGQNSIAISLPHKAKKVKVKFADDCHTIPCDQSRDFLDWYSTDHHKHNLVITWDVSDIRTVFWEVKF